MVKNMMQFKNDRPPPFFGNATVNRQPFLSMIIKCFRPLVLCALALIAASLQAADTPGRVWKLETPIVTYWAGPGFPNGADLTDAAATQMAEGGWNLVWCEEKELDVVHRHGLHGLITFDLLNPATLNDPAKRAELDAFIDRVRKHPGMYAYHLIDEPSAVYFPELGKLVAYLRERDPDHLAYINILPTYANNEQLGIKGNTVEAYTEHLRQYVDVVRPSLLSYDHYHLTNSGDQPHYFLNLGLMRGRSLAAGVPFMNIVPASSWGPTPLASPNGPRIPNGDEMRFLVYTTLAYGAQGISYYVYSFPGHYGSIAEADGTPTPLYHALKPLNREFVAIARELQPLRSLGVYHAGMQPPGVEPLPADGKFSFDPPVEATEYKSGERVQGLVLSQYGAKDAADVAGMRVMVVNLDYKAEKSVALKGPGSLEIFDPAGGQWSACGGTRAELRFPPGGGKLLRVAKARAE